MPVLIHIKLSLYLNYLHTYHLFHWPEGKVFLCQCNTSMVQVRWAVNGLYVRLELQLLTDSILTLQPIGSRSIEQ